MLRAATRSALLMAALAALATILAFAGLTRGSVASAAEPVSFMRSTLTGLGITFVRPTALAVGPDGRLYVAEQEGRVRAFTLNPTTKAIAAVEQVAASGDLQEVFGIAFDPTDASSPPPVYVSNTVSGVGNAGPAPAGTFPGKVTKIHGASYANMTDIITGLPISNFAHQTNGIMFAGDGTLYIAQGSTTNAGLPGGPFSHAEVPLSSAILVADPSAPAFDGTIVYDPANTYDTTVDQVSGDVSVYAPGLRNPYDLVIHSNGRMYATDNGPNSGGGAASTSCATQGAGPQGPDELNIIDPGNYYGHPNRNRGRFDPRQCVYHSGTEGSGAEWTGPIALLPPSSNGLVEYTASRFGGKLQGNLLYVSWVSGTLGRAVLSPDGSSVVSHTDLETGFNQPLDIAMSGDGTLFVAEYGGDVITVLRPDDAPVGGIAEIPEVDLDTQTRNRAGELRSPLLAGLAAGVATAVVALGLVSFRRRAK